MVNVKGVTLVKLYIYIYIYIYDWIQVTLSVILNNVTPFNIFLIEDKF